MYPQELGTDLERRRRPRNAELRPSRSTDVQKLLATVPLFSECSKSELRLLARTAQIESRAPGAELVTEGNTGTHAYVILQGTCRVIRKGRKVGKVGAGGVVGELSMLNPAPRNAAVEAETPLEVAIFGRREFLALIDRSPSISHKLLQNLAARLQDLDSRTPS